MKPYQTVFVTLSVLFVSGAGCTQKSAAADASTKIDIGQSAAQAVQQTPNAVAATETGPRVVFVGKRNACDCTRKAIDASWRALQMAIGQAAKPSVEKIEVDVDLERVEIFRKQKPIMALPALYVVGEQNVVIEQLQGEVTEAQVRAAIERLRK